MHQISRGFTADASQGDGPPDLGPLWALAECEELADATGLLADARRHSYQRWEVHRSRRSAVYEHAARAARDAAQQIRHFAVTDPAGAADAAWAAADTLNAAARALGNQELRRAADAYDRAARSAYGRLPRPTPTGNRLRAAARILSAVAIVTGDPLIAQLRLILQLAALTEAVTGLRTAQRHAAQASAARAAAERLYAARRSYTSPPGGRATARAQGNQAARDFPISVQQVLAEASAKAYPPEPAAPSRPSRGPPPPRQRGPTR